MSNRQKKRRTFSDSENQRVPSLGTQISEISPLVQRNKRRPSNARQARLVMFPNFNSFGLQPSNSTGAVQTLQTNQTYTNPPQPAPTTFQQPDPYVTANAIYFTIPPRSDVTFHFTMDRGIGQHVHLVSRSGQIPFILNGNQYIGTDSGTDVTPATIRGQNHIQFLSQNRQNTAFAELHLGNPVDINNLIQHIVNDYPLLPPSPPDPYTTKTCPLSHTTIVIPAKGIACSHAQCFDLKSYIENSLETDSWICPVCQSSLPYESLRVEHNYLESLTPPPVQEKPSPEEKDIFFDIGDDWKNGPNDWDYFS